MKFNSLKAFVILICLSVFLSGCSSTTQEKKITIAAAASLEKIFTDRLLPLFVEKNPGIKVEGTYSGSGNLQLQIEQGLPADIFISASPKQMDALVRKGLVKKENVVELLENKLVLIIPKDSKEELTNFEDLVHCKQLAFGDPKSVPAGQYAYEVLGNLQIWDKVSKNASFGNSVTEVLYWVAEGSAEAGIVYATDAHINNKVKIVAEAPADKLRRPVIYCLGILNDKEASKKLAEFLVSDEAQKIFREYGFTSIKR